MGWHSLHFVRTNEMLSMVFKSRLWGGITSTSFVQTKSYPLFLNQVYGEAQPPLRSYKRNAIHCFYIKFMGWHSLHFVRTNEMLSMVFKSRLWGGITSTSFVQTKSYPLFLNQVYGEAQPPLRSYKRNAIHCFYIKFMGWHSLHFVRTKKK